MNLSIDVSGFLESGLLYPLLLLDKAFPILATNNSIDIICYFTSILMCTSASFSEIGFSLCVVTYLVAYYISAVHMYIVSVSSNYLSLEKPQ